MGTLKVVSYGCYKMATVGQCEQVKFENLADVAQYASDKGYEKVEIDARALARFAPQALAV